MKIYRTILVIPFPRIAFGNGWWLPTNYSVHGRETDALFQWFFWVTFAVFVLVEMLLVIFVLKYRSRAKQTKARHFHGNAKVEFAWIAITTAIIGSLAFGSERVWRDYRNSPDLDNPARSKILVIGQQFKWNVIYPGPDGKFGRYLIYPKPTDLTWPVRPDGKPEHFANVPGPASLPYKDAVEAINTYIDTENPLGKDFSDPDGKDDDWSFAPGRPIYVPVNRPVEVDLESKDVIHDFFIPNFRAQLYAVPGMRGRFVFTPTITTKELEAESKRSISLNDLQALFTDPVNRDFSIDIDATCPGAQQDQIGWRYVDPTMAEPQATFIRDQSIITAQVVAELKAIGIKQVLVHKPQPFEVACAQLCGPLHYTMRNALIVLSQEEFDRRFPAAPHVK